MRGPGGWEVLENGRAWRMEGTGGYEGLEEGRA